MSVRMECKICGDVYESDDVMRVIRWDASHQDSCKGTVEATDA